MPPAPLGPPPERVWRARLTGGRLRLRRAAPAQVAEDILAAGDADLVSMARPFLADPFLLSKAAEGREELINTW